MDLIPGNFILIKPKIKIKTTLGNEMSEEKSRLGNCSRLSQWKGENGKVF